MTLSRRGFLGGGVKGGVTVLGAAAGLKVLSRQAHAVGDWAYQDLSPESPDSHQIATLKAMADTFIPNWDGAPGGIESDAFATINDPYYGVNPYISEIVSDLDDYCWWTYFWTDFLDHGNSNRLQILEERMSYRAPDWDSCYQDVYFGIMSLTKLNFFGGLVNSAGTNYIGWPGPSNGYATSSAAGAYHATSGATIPDNNATGINSYISASGAGTVSSLKVTVWINHPYIGDLVVKLYSPAGTVHTLHNRTGGSADNVIIHNLNITTFNGQTAAGSWRLHVADLAGADVGTLKFWSFKLRTNLDEIA
jgi:subtilisin-like proprotein convertase family protein